jgi:nucleotide-binding universal stress UspA family protein
MSGKIIALIDGSIYLRSVCDLAAWAALRSGWSVDLLHVLGRRNLASLPFDLSGSLNIDERDTLLAELTTLDEQRSKLAQQRGRLILSQGTGVLEAAGVGAHTARLRHGDLIEAVQELEAEADLIVIGKRGEAADFAKLHLGSNLERIARAAHRPVLVAARAFKPIERVMIAFDGGTSSTRAVSYLAQSRLFQALRVRMLTVSAGTGDLAGRIEDAAVSLRTAGLVVETKVLPGEADAVIAREVQEQGIDLLVMGAFGHSRLRNLFIGSTTTEMIRSCKIPILLFR